MQIYSKKKEKVYELQSVKDLKDFHEYPLDDKLKSVQIIKIFTNLY